MWYSSVQSETVGDIVYISDIAEYCKRNGSFYKITKPKLHISHEQDLSRKFFVEWNILKFLSCTCGCYLRKAGNLSGHIVLYF